MSDKWDYGRNRRDWPFVGVDGEGGDIPDPDALFGTRHVYQLLRVGGRSVENPAGLSFTECAEFLCSLPPRCIYVGYFFDYDVTMMLKSVPEERARRIMDRDKRTRNGWNLLPVDIGPYQVDYLPHKEFRIRRKGTGEPFTIISDVGQFFQSAFLTTIKKWGVGTPSQWDQIEAGKKLRGDFTFMTDEIRRYNDLEIMLLEELMTRFRDVCYDVGYVPKKWQGPGYLASAMLTAHKVPQRRDIPIMRNEDFKRLANDAYYGGRFETTATGPVAGPVYQYDINSAYPSVLRSLPCLHHGSWKRIQRVPDNPDSIFFGEIHFTHDSGRLLHNLPFRDKKGNITFPREGIGVYWSSEIRAAERAGTTCAFMEGWEYERHCTCSWFDWIDAFYARRLELGKTDKGIVLKLGGNSIYGKIAQSIGYAPWANPVWAGMITAGCRAMLIDAYAACQDQVYMLATDGLFTGVPLDVPVSKALGEWDLTEHPEGVFIVQPGIYFLPDEGPAVLDRIALAGDVTAVLDAASGDVKTRGVERGRIGSRRGEFEDAWAVYLKTQKSPVVTVDVVNFITIKQALARRKWHIAGSWDKATRDVSFDWSVKRQAGIAWSDSRGTLRTLPPGGDKFARSAGYDRIIGGELRPSLMDDRYRDIGLLEKERMDEQPDWVEPFIVT